MSANIPNLLNYDRQAMQEFFASIGETTYRAEQVLKWMHKHGVADFAHMTNLSRKLREKLVTAACIAVPEIICEKIAPDGTYKWLLKLADGNCIETVFIPENNRGTLCVSSQVGCILNCDFCSTGKQGFNRNLTTAEIIGQVWLAVRKLSHLNGTHDHQVTNVVMMGMGEPLLNFANLIPALNLMLDDFAYGLSKYRVTVSTAGVVPAMYQLRDLTEVALAVSLHAANDALRNRLVPLNKKYPLHELIGVCKNYFSHQRRAVTMEYVMLAGINDRPADAHDLIRLLSGIRAKINLIPFNPFPHTDYQRSSDQTILTFRNQLTQAGLHTTVRRTRGDEITAACGQLVGAVQDKTKRKQRHLRKIEVLNNEHEQT